MKEMDEEWELMEEAETESFRQELDRIFQHTLYLNHLVNSHMETNTVKYSEAAVPTVMRENEDETKEINERFQLIKPQPLKHKLPQ